MATFTYPDNVTLTQVGQDKMPVLQGDRLGLRLLPPLSKNTSLLIWEQRDNYVGVQQIRGINGEPPSVKQVGAKVYQMQPGYYGEFAFIDEASLTDRRALGSFGDPVPMGDLVAERQDQLIGRQFDRMELLIWMLLTTGTYAVITADGVTAAGDTFALQTYTAAVPWSTFATATPLADLRAVQLLARGHSVRFDASAMLIVNQRTWNNILSNTNSADIYGRRTTGFGTINSMDAFNQLLTADNLPTIVVYDNGYLNDAGTFVPFIADGKGVLIGKRTTGEPIGNMVMTRNANNPGAAPGPYSKVVAEEDVPISIEVHQGWNGGPVVYFASALVILNV